MTYYHGTIKQNLHELNVNMTPLSTMHVPLVYFTDDPVMAALYIWRLPYKWMTYDFSEAGELIYTEWFPDQLSFFYNGVSGTVYSSDSASIEKTHMQKVFCSKISIPVLIYKNVPNAYEEIIRCERDNMLKIIRYEELSLTDKEKIEKQVIKAIKRERLFQNLEKAEFVKSTFPSAWEKAIKEEL